MKMDKSVLMEMNGRWLLDGQEITIGGEIRVEGMPCTILGWGRLPAGLQTPYLWIRHQRRGITIYAPSLTRTENPSPLCLTVA